MSVVQSGVTKRVTVAELAASVPFANISLYDQRSHHNASATAATLTSAGSTTVTATGTQSAVAAAQNSPNADRLTHAATANVAAGAQSAIQTVCIGAASDWAVSGFDVRYTVRFNDASYNEAGASTGCRIGVGLSSGGALATVLGNDNLANNWIGFIRRSVNAGAIDPAWMIAVRGASALSTQTTTMPFVAQHWYTLRLTMDAGATSVGWAIEDRTAGTAAQGSWTPSSNLPVAATMLAVAVGVCTVNAVARSVDVNGFAVTS